MIKSCHDFYNKKLKYGNQEEQGSCQNDDDEIDQHSANKISKVINSTNESNDSFIDDSSSCSHSSASPTLNVNGHESQDPVVSSATGPTDFRFANYHANFPTANHFYNNSANSYQIHHGFGYNHPNVNGLGLNHHHHHYAAGLYGHHPYPPAGYNPAFNTFAQASQFRLNAKQDVINEKSHPSRNSIDSSADSLNSNSLSSPISAVDENSLCGSVNVKNGGSHPSAGVYYNNHGATGPHQHMQLSNPHLAAPLSVPPVINPASLLLRVNKPGGGGDGGRETAQKKRRPLPAEVKDPSYWERRKKNNESAKRSRDMKRTKEEQLSMRVIYLEQENLQLRTEVGLLRSETEQMRLTLYPQLRKQQNQHHSQQQIHSHHGQPMSQQQHQSQPAGVNTQSMLLQAN